MFSSAFLLSVIVFCTVPFGAVLAYRIIGSDEFEAFWLPFLSSLALALLLAIAAWGLDDPSWQPRRAEANYLLMIAVAFVAGLWFMAMFQKKEKKTSSKIQPVQHKFIGR